MQAFVRTSVSLIRLYSGSAGSVRRVCKRLVSVHAGVPDPVIDAVSVLVVREGVPGTVIDVVVPRPNSLGIVLAVGEGVQQLRVAVREGVHDTVRESRYCLRRRGLVCKQWLQLCMGVYTAPPVAYPSHLRSFRTPLRRRARPRAAASAGWRPRRGSHPESCPSAAPCRE